MTVKGQALKALLAGDEVSGQSIGSQCGVSRSAVWKAVQSLQAEGYGIEAKTNGGYRLTGVPEALSEAGIEARLTEPMRVCVMDTVDSTNAMGKRQLVRGLNEPALIAAEYQSAGRGRMGREFFSPAGAGLYMTLVLPCGKPREEAMRITMEASVAVCRALGELSGQEYQIKWVNDIYYDGRKVCGILTEAVSDLEDDVIRFLVLGIGVNVKPAAVPEDLKAVMGWLPLPVDRNALAAGIANRIRSGMDDVLSYYRAHSMVLGRPIRYRENNQWKPAFALEIDDAGGLVIREEDGSVKTLSSGEISVRVEQ